MPMANVSRSAARSVKYIARHTRPIRLAPSRPTRTATSLHFQADMGEPPVAQCATSTGSEVRLRTVRVAPPTTISATGDRA